MPNTDLIGIYVEDDTTLLSRLYKHELAKRINELELSRHGLAHWLMTIIYGHMETGGKIYDGDGDEIYLYPDIIEDAYFDDDSHCWNTNIKKFADCMPKRRSSERLILRLQLFDAAFWIIGDPVVQPE